MGNQLDDVMGGVLCITSSREVGGYRRLDTFQDSRIVHGGPLGFLSNGAPYTFFATVSLAVNVNALGNVMGGVLL